MPLSRRQMLKLSAAALLAANLWPGRLRAAETPTKPLKFIQVNDLHYSEDACAPFFEGLVKEFNKIDNAAFVLIVGDLIDAGNAGQAHAIHDILRALKIPYYVTPGNHDHLTDTDRSPFEAAFGTKFNDFFESNGWQFLALDTSEGTKYEKVSVQKPTLDYVATLPAKMDQNKPTFVYTHFPLGPGVQYELVNAAAVLEPLKQLNLAAIFNGHYHGFTEKKVNADIIVTTNCCCSRKRASHDNKFQKGFFILEAGAAGDNKWKRTFTEYGTFFPGGVQVANRKPPEPLPPRPEDQSRPWY